MFGLHGPSTAEFRIRKLNGPSQYTCLVGINRQNHAVVIGAAEVLEGVELVPSIV